MVAVYSANEGITKAMTYENYYQTASTVADTILAGAGPSPETAGTYRRGLGSRSTDEQKSRLKAAAEQGIQMASAGDLSQDTTAARMIAAMRGAKNPEQLDIREYLPGTVTDMSGTTSSGKSIYGATELQALADRTEGGADYNTLFGFANQKGKAFEGVNISTMTIGDLLKFSAKSGRYGQHVKANNNGVLATPMGRYQFVGTTLGAVAKDMGLSADTVFSPEVQDKMFVFHARQVLAGGNTAAEKRNRLRKTWVGFNNVSDEELDSAIRQITLSTRPKANPITG